MTDEYDQITSFHYSAYRPPLHNLILDKCISLNRTYATGLDLGCGTGQSSIALASFCQEVIGLDPSESMLNKSISHNNVKYHLFNGIDLVFPDDKFDIITFAGSLYYGKSQRLLDEVIRVSKQKAKIILYDFEINLNNILVKLIDWSSYTNIQKYNYEEDFSGLNQNNLQKEISSKDEVSLKISNSDILHLLLAAKDLYVLLLEKFGERQLDTKISSGLNRIIPLKTHEFKVNIYYTIYGVVK